MTALPTPDDRPAWTLADLPATSVEIVAKLRANGFDAEHAVMRQVLNLAEEAGEFVGAYRRWAGHARRSGTAEELDVDPEALIGQKLAVVFSRGWREERAS